MKHNEVILSMGVDLRGIYHHEVGHEIGCALIRTNTVTERVTIVTLLLSVMCYYCNIVTEHVTIVTHNWAVITSCILLVTRHVTHYITSLL